MEHPPMGLLSLDHPLLGSSVLLTCGNESSVTVLGSAFIGAPVLGSVVLVSSVVFDETCPWVNCP